MKALAILFACVTLMLQGCTQQDAPKVAAAPPSASPTPAPKTQLDMDRDFVAQHRAEFECSSQMCLDNLRMEMKLVEDHFGYEFGHQYDLCLAYEPTKPKNITHCKQVFQRVDRMHKQFEDAEAKRKANW